MSKEAIALSQLYFIINVKLDKFNVTVKTCHLGIAMGNACRELKDCADYVTADIDDDGLAKALYYAMDRLG